MGLNDNEISAVNEQRRNEDLGLSPVGDVLSSGASIAGATIAFGASVVAGGPAGLAVAGSVVAGMGIVDWFRKLGTSKVNGNLEALGHATEDAFNRVERVLAEQGKSIEEIQRRFESEDLKQAMAGASLQALRTSNETRLRRLALILANGVKENDLASVSTDDIMRAAVELKDDDIRVLDQLCKEQAEILATTGKTHGDLWPDDVRRNWQNHLFDHKIPGRSGQHYLDWKSSLARLSAFGFLIPVLPVQTVNSPGHEPYGVTLQGVEFLEHLEAE